MKCKNKDRKKLECTISVTKSSIVDLVIVLLAGIGTWIVLRGNAYIGVVFIIVATVISFERSLGYKLLKFFEVYG